MKNISPYNCRFSRPTVVAVAFQMAAALTPPRKSITADHRFALIRSKLCEIFHEKFYRFSDYLGITSQMSELLGISSISGILRFGRYPAYHGISEPHLAVKSSKTVVENRPYY